ncbi:MAG: hypothetical protein JST00_38470 [Deltaproteobacteria bacterium]|nr:hypothetical protein [Deltaproteobacteria bacterium]
MTSTGKKIRAALIALLALVAVGFLVTKLAEQRTPPTSPTDFVPTSWEASRTTPMHVIHIGKGKVACKECHADGFAKAPTAIRDDVCARCHEKPAERAHHGSERSPTTCLTCHTFAAGKQAPTCLACHGKTADVAPTQAARAAHELARHASKDVACNACHAAHGEKGKTRAVLPDCTACHANVSAKHGGVALAPPVSDDALSLEAAAARFIADAGAAVALRDAGATSGDGKMCTTCHAPHAEAKLASGGCATCHAAQRPALVTAKHPACTTCHTPHQPGAARGVCRTCHSNVHVLAEAKVPGHAACQSCHDPHRPGAPPALACARCHESMSPKHPAFTVKGGATSACVGCHAPHGGPAASASHPASAASCTTCHAKAANERAFHAVGKTECTSCHTPHAFATSAVGAAACARCHAPEAKRVEARSGHADCKSCHGQAHAPNAKPACASCHGQEASSAPRGHSACGSCHDAHSGSLGKHVECTSCHADKTKAAKALHTSLPGACASCHRPHGPKGVASPPACSTCHAPSTLVGLHSVSAHASSCASCHSSHGPPRSDRATCTGSCHADRKTHQPDAQLCKGCHLFRR